jgi:pimeloyl-ACP methyl ester carboxylesterase/DNA-binding CsgD family transcriptional regulator
MPVPTQYAKSGDVSIAYQIVGDGPIDLVFVMGWVSHLDYFWEGPSAGFLTRLASFSRLILFDKRGTGLSDRVAAMPSLEQRMDDVRAVMDAAGSKHAALFGISEGAAMCALFAATYPARTDALVMYGAYAKRLWDAAYPWAPTPADRQRFFDAIAQGWGGVVDLDTLAPSTVGDERFRRWWATYLRSSASPGAALALARMNTEIDIRPVLPAIRVPTLILHRTGDLDIDVNGARFMAERIPGARYVELPGDDHLAFAGDQDAILDEIQQFLTGVRPAREADRVLATVLAVRINAATTAARLGDQRWRDVRAEYDAMLRAAVDRFLGREAVGAVDGGIATFDGPARAVRCAEEIVREAQDLGLQARAGLHTGEVIAAGDGVIGVALHLAAQIAAQASVGEVVVSNTVKDLVVGSGLDFQPLGDRVFPGLPGEWRLFRLASEASPALTAARVQAREDRAGATPSTSTLSPREQEVLRLLVVGSSDREIAERLFISSRTASKHVGNILAKLDVGSRGEAAVRAVQDDLI